MTKAKHTAGWAVSACEDANGFHTIRVSDGTEDGDTEEQPIATVYELEHAHLIAAAPGLLKFSQEALKIWDDYYKDSCEGDEDYKHEVETFENLRSAIKAATA